MTTGSTGAADARREEDAALVARCRRGDAAAWAEIVRRYERLVYAIPMRMRLDEATAADVFQTVFSRLVQQIDRLADPSRLQAWLVTTAKRESLLQRDRSRRTVSLTPAGDGEADTPSADLEVPDDTPIAEAALADLQELQQLRLALDELGGRCAELLRLLFADDDEKPDYGEIARRLGIAVGSIGPTRARCLAKLRQLYDSQGSGGGR